MFLEIKSLGEAVYSFVALHIVSTATFLTAVFLGIDLIYKLLTRKRLRVNVTEWISLNARYEVINSGTEPITYQTFGTVLLDGKSYTYRCEQKTLAPSQPSELQLSYLDGRERRGFSTLLHEALKHESGHVYYVYVQEMVTRRKYRFYPHGYFKAHIYRFWYWVTRRKLNYETQA